MIVVPFKSCRPSQRRTGKGSLVQQKGAGNGSATGVRAVIAVMAAREIATDVPMLLNSDLGKAHSAVPNGLGIEPIFLAGRSGSGCRITPTPCRSRRSSDPDEWRTASSVHRLKCLGRHGKSYTSGAHAARA